MTDRLKGCIVTFDRSIRTDDAEAILDAIRMVKGVMAVNPSVDDFGDVMARERVRRELGDKMWQVLYPKDEK